MAVERFEYRVETVHVSKLGADAADLARLDEWGAEGWEAVGFSPSHASGHGLRVETTDYVVLLKRRVPAGQASRTRSR